MSKCANKSIEHCVKIYRYLNNFFISLRNFLYYVTTRHENDIVRLASTPCFKKKTSTHIIGYKLRNGCPILIIFDIKIPQII